MSEAELATLLAFFKALANESRLRIVGLLSERERSVQELAELLEVTEPTVSHHLAVLKGLGLVTVRVEGVTHWHILRPEALTEFNKALFDPGQVARMATPKKSWDEKVLSTFVAPGGTLTSIPASRRKRWIILKWLAEQFEEGRAYPEAQVNEIIQRAHWDCATLRREMIGYGMMVRESGIFMRQPEAVWSGEAEKTRPS